MASATLFASPSSSSSSSSSLQGGKGKDAVYVAAVPLRAARGPAQLMMTATYSLGLWDLQHFMVIIKPNPSQSKAFVFDFQPQNPEDVFVALAALSRREVPGVILKRELGRLPKSTCWLVGLSNTGGVTVADKFNEDWPTSLIIGKHDCRHYTSGNTPFSVIPDSSHLPQDFKLSIQYVCPHDS